MNSLCEAIVLVVIVSLLGTGLAFGAADGAGVPITIFITFGMAHMLGIDLRQMSIATLIIALGLLVDVPVVAGDAMGTAGRVCRDHRRMGGADKTHGDHLRHPHSIVAYLPFLTLPGSTGNFYTACRSC
jgi:multidrug efflux pump subunit AcrB